MTEPVKIVIVMEDGVLSAVLSCGIPVEYAVINYEDRDWFEDSCPDKFFSCPQLDAEPVDAVGYIERAEMENPAHALAMFDAVAAHYIDAP